MSKLYDVRIPKITKIFGPPTVTRDRLKQYLLDEFAEHQLTTKYGVIKSIRMPFSQDTNGTHYFGFLTMTSPEVHDRLLIDLAKITLRFGDLELSFEKAESMRIPYTAEHVGRKCRRKWNSSGEEVEMNDSVEDVSVRRTTPKRTGSEPEEIESEKIRMEDVKALSACSKKIKIEPLYTATIDTSAHDINEEIQRQWVKIREEKAFNVSVADQNHLDRMRLDKWEEELQEREKRYWLKHREDEEYEARLQYVDRRVLDLMVQEEALEQKSHQLEQQQRRMSQREKQIERRCLEIQKEAIEQQLVRIQDEIGEQSEPEQNPRPPIYVS